MPRRPSFTEAQVRAAVAAEFSYSGVLRRLGLRAAGGNHRTIRRYIDRVWQIPTDHFDPYGQHTRHRSARPLQEVLVENSSYDRRTLKMRLFREGLKRPECELCGQGEIWHGRRMSLILDHINGVWNDNRLENLRVVCANCNATLDTHCGRNVSMDRRVPRECLHCHELFTPERPRQRYCSRECGQRWDRRGRPIPGARRAERPPYEQLLKEIAESSYVAVGRRYGVTGNAIRKWVRAYEREREESAVTDEIPHARAA